MKQKPRFRLRFVDYTPRIVVADPYYTIVEITQFAVGVVGVLVSIIAVVDGTGVTVPSLGIGIIFLLVYLVIDLSLVRAESLQGRLSVPGADISEMICRFSRHTFRPEGTTTADRFGLSPREQPPQMIWTCTRCGEERWLEPGISPK